MPIPAALRKLFGVGDPPTYMVVWREETAKGAFMKGEPVRGESDLEATSLVRNKFANAGSDWTFWVLFRPDDTKISSQAGPKIERWPHNFARVDLDSHVKSTLRALHQHNKPLSRSLREIRLKAFGGTARDESSSP